MIFSDWIQKKYVEWRGDAIGNDRSITEFAAMLGVPQSLMSQWMKKGGKTPRHHKYITALAKLGSDVYDVLGLPRPSFDLPFDALPPEMRKALFEATHELADTLASYKINPASPEGEALTVEVLEKHGFKWIDTKKSEQPG